MRNPLRYHPATSSYFRHLEDEMVEAVKQAARDAVCDLVRSFPIPEALSDAEVLDVLHSMRGEVDVAIRLHSAATEEVHQ